MKQILGMVFLIATTATALASREDGISEAAQACSKLLYDSDKKECLKSVGDANYFSVPAVTICSKLLYDKDKKSCIGGIANKDIRDFEAEACGKLLYDSEKQSCLVQVQRSTPRRGRSSDRGERKKDSDGISEAAEACSKLLYGTEKKECLKNVGNAYHFSVPAVAVCSKLLYDRDKKSCIAAIANKDIRDFEAKACGELLYDSEKQSCLGNIQRTAPKRGRS